MLAVDTAPPTAADRSIVADEKTPPRSHTPIHKPHPAPVSTAVADAAACCCYCCVYTLEVYLQVDRYRYAGDFLLVSCFSGRYYQFGMYLPIAIYWLVGLMFGRIPAASVGIRLLANVTVRHISIKRWCYLGRYISPQATLPSGCIAFFINYYVARMALHAVAFLECAKGGAQGQLKLFWLLTLLKKKISKTAK